MTDQRPPYVDPGTRQPLRFQTESSRIVNPTTNESWPVVDGIPRFVESEHLGSFARQWNRFEVAHDAEDRATFAAKTGWRLSDLEGRTVLDAGCGGGRYCRVAAQAGAIVTGVDHTRAVAKARSLCEGLANVRLVQADLKRLPFLERQFDFVFSIGVMHHDAETRAVFDALARMVRPGGSLAVWVYRRNQWWQEAINSAVRRATTRLPANRLESLCRVGAALGAIPVINRSLNKIINFSAHPDPQNRLCDTFDWYAPKFQHHHTVAEVMNWFEAAGFTETRLLPPEKRGCLYNWSYRRNLLIGSGVNVVGRCAESASTELENETSGDSTSPPRG